MFVSPHASSYLDPFYILNAVSSKSSHPTFLTALSAKFQNFITSGLEFGFKIGFSYYEHIQGIVRIIGNLLYYVLNNHLKSAKLEALKLKIMW